MIDATMKEIVDTLMKFGKTISVMESCTGGLLSSSITNVEGSSDVFHFGAVTYSNEFKVKMGVSREVIEKYTVYSMETAKEMSFSISSFSNSDYGVGITGKLNRVDEKNFSGEDNRVFISIYDRLQDVYYTSSFLVVEKGRSNNKEEVVLEFIRLFQEKVIKCKKIQKRNS